HDDGAAPALLEDVDAKARNSGEAVREIRRPILFQFVDGRFVFAHDVAGDGEGVLRSKALEPFVFQFDELAADLDLWSAPGRENQVADMRAGLEHGSNELRRSNLPLRRRRRWRGRLVG